MMRTKHLFLIVLSLLSVSYGCPRADTMCCGQSPA